MHDLKNLIAQQSLMVKNASKHKGNPEFFEDAMATIENSVARMNKLMRQLQSGDTSGPRERVGLSEALDDALQKTETGKPEPRFENAGESLFAYINRERFTAVIVHLIRNAQEATSSDGSVTVGLKELDGHAVISIVDDGCGMAADFIRNRLFRPFDSTKGSKGMGIGAYQARTFVAESGGVMNVESQTDQGTQVLIRLPIAGEDMEVEG
jgi:putative PEP-CTERM system histidine kinase